MGNTVIIHKDDFAYISHPSITVLKGGDWLAAFNHSRKRERRMHPPSDPLFRSLTAKSIDGGATWDSPVFAPDFDWYGTECPGIATTSRGTVLLSQFRFGWYPLAKARKRRAEGENISIYLPEQQSAAGTMDADWDREAKWTEDFEDDDWDRALLTWARGYHGLYIHRSFDEGLTYEDTVKIDTGNYRDGYTRTGVRQLVSGRLAYVVTEHHGPANRFTYVVFSDDDGASWTAPTVVCDDPKRMFGEPDLVETAPGKLYCVLRESRISGCLYGCRSTDNGASWSTPEITSIYGHPGQLLKLSDGRLLCTYGRRVKPFGIRAALSEDSGQSWKTENELVIRSDLPNGDLGYPTSIEYEPGKLFCIYYAQEPDGVTCVTGTYFEVL